MKRVMLLVLVLASVPGFALSACGSPEKGTTEEDMVTYSNNGITFSIPEKYTGLYNVDTPSNGGPLFRVFDNEAVEAGEVSKDFPDEPGLLFMIDTVTEEEYHELLCNKGIRYFEVFAKDDNGVYYVIFCPDYPFGSAGTYIGFEISFMYYYPFLDYTRFIYPKTWSAGTENGEKLEFVEWVSEQMKDLFIADNSMISEKHGKGLVTRYFSKILYEDEPVSTIDFFAGHDSETVADLLKLFVYDVSYKEIGVAYENFATPEERHEMLYLSDPRINIEIPVNNKTADFLLISFYGGNYIGICFYGPNQVDSQCMSYKAVFEDETLNAEKIMRECLQTVDGANSGY